MISNRRIFQIQIQVTNSVDSCFRASAWPTTKNRNEKLRNAWFIENNQERKEESDTEQPKPLFHFTAK